MRRLFEKKEDQIKKQILLSEEEKEILIRFFNQHPEQDSKCTEFGIDWNRRENTADKFFNLVNSFNKRFLPKLELRDLKPGIDYSFVGKDYFYNYYFIFSHKGAVTVASNNVAPEIWTKTCGWGYARAISYDENTMKDYPIKVSEDGATTLKGGAKWCIAVNHTDTFWNDYIFGKHNEGYGYYFIFACARIPNIEERYKKIAIQLDTEKEFDYFFDMFDACDNSYSNPPFGDFADGYKEWDNFEVIHTVKNFIHTHKERIEELEKEFDKIHKHKEV